MKERYSRNIPAISIDEQEALAEKTAAVIGCGGLGGYILEELARIGVGHLVFADGDVFSESNLNRQLLSSVDNIGKSKAEIAEKHIRSINPDIKLTAVNNYLSADGVSELLFGCDVVIDALDNVSDRLVLEDLCAEKAIPLVHGAVKGWNLQLAVSEPGSGCLHRLFANAVNNQPKHAADNTKEIDSEHKDRFIPEKTCLCFTPACCAALQTAEALKLLLGRPSNLAGRVLFMDLQSMESYTIEI